MRNFAAFASGGLFGLGLLISGMTDTRKVIGWLDFFGNWDPTLAFVLGGAILPMAAAWRIARRRTSSVLGNALPAPAGSRIDPALIVGSLMFGAGWGLTGLCPGPAITSISWGGISGVVFLASMAAGMAAAPRLREGLSRYVNTPSAQG